MKDVKVGDVVYIDIKVKCGLFSSESFTVPIVVNKVTAKQFVASNGKRYSKGPYMSGIGHDGRAFINGSDQRPQLEAFREKVAAIDKARALIKKLEFDYRANYSKEDLQGLIQSLQKFSK